jgi:RNA polymerase sigma-70 factor (ECF subfamily)
MGQEIAKISLELGRAREEFLELVAEIRPELHRYCARLAGSVIEGEDLVQESLARAFYALSLSSEVPPLRPWLFRIAHNTAIDFLRRYENKHVVLQADLDDSISGDEAMDPAILRAALASFLSLPVQQRSVVILKDVLGHSLEETADTMATTVPAVKAALFRGRTTLRMRNTQSEPAFRGDAKDARAERQRLQNYVALFNARNWDGLRALMGEECRLDLVSRAARQGAAVREYLARYSNQTDAYLELGTVEGQPALLCSRQPGAPTSYFILLQWEGDRVSFIRDFRYVSYIAREAEIAATPELSASASAHE